MKCQEERLHVSADRGVAGHCEHCGWPLSEPFDVLSRHRTSRGVVVYSLCACGLFRVHVRPFDSGEDRVVARLGKPSK